MDLENYANEALDRLGVPCRLLGRGYLIVAIRIFHENPYIPICQLYKDVAKAVDTTPKRAERAMRNAIEKGIENCGSAEIYEYFGNTISASKGKPTNGEFIARVNHMYDMECDK